MTKLLQHSFTLQPQEAPYHSIQSNCFFNSRGKKHVVMTQGINVKYGNWLALEFLDKLKKEAEIHHGLDYLQVFKDKDGHTIWVIEDPEVITVLLPEEY